MDRPPEGSPSSPSQRRGSGARRHSIGSILQIFAGDGESETASEHGSGPRRPSMRHVVLAEEARRKTEEEGRRGIPIQQWMHPERYRDHLFSLSQDGRDKNVRDMMRGVFCQDGRDKKILEIMRGVFDQELPWPWVVQKRPKEGGYRFVNEHCVPEVWSWYHPLQELHHRLVQLLKEAYDGESCRSPYMRSSLESLIGELLSGAMGLKHVGAWYQMPQGSFAPVSDKPCYLRKEDPRLEAASTLGLALRACQIVSLQVLREELPSGDVWLLAAPVAERVLRPTPDRPCTWDDVAAEHDQEELMEERVAQMSPTAEPAAISPKMSPSVEPAKITPKMPPTVESATITTKMSPTAEPAANPKAKEEPPTTESAESVKEICTLLRATMEAFSGLAEKLTPPKDPGPAKGRLYGTICARTREGEEINVPPARRQAFGPPEGSPPLDSGARLRAQARAEAKVELEKKGMSRTAPSQGGLPSLKLPEPGGPQERRREHPRRASCDGYPSTFGPGAGLRSVGRQRACAAPAEPEPPPAETSRPAPGCPDVVRHPHEPAAAQIVQSRPAPGSPDVVRHPPEPAAAQIVQVVREEGPLVRVEVFQPAAARVISAAAVSPALGPGSPDGPGAPPGGDEGARPPPKSGGGPGDAPPPSSPQPGAKNPGPAPQGSTEAAPAPEEAPLPPDLGEQPRLAGGDGSAGVAQDAAPVEEVPASAEAPAATGASSPEPEPKATVAQASQTLPSPPVGSARVRVRLHAGGSKSAPSSPAAKADKGEMADSKPRKAEAAPEEQAAKADKGESADSKPCKVEAAPEEQATESHRPTQPASGVPPSPDPCSPATAARAGESGGGGSPPTVASPSAIDVKAEVRKEVDSQRAELLLETTRSVDKTVQEEVRRSQLQAQEEQKMRDEQIRQLLQSEVAKAREETRQAASEMMQLMKQREEHLTERAMEMSKTVERVMADAKTAEQQQRIEAENALRKLEEQRQAERISFERELERRAKELELERRKELELKAERKVEQLRAARREQELKEEVLQMKLQQRQVGEAMVRDLEEGDLMRPPCCPNLDPPCDSARSTPIPRSHSRLHEALRANGPGDQDDVAPSSLSEPTGSSRCSWRLWEAVHADLQMPEGSTRSPTRKLGAQQASSVFSSTSSLKSAGRSARSSAPQLGARSRPASANIRGRPAPPGDCGLEGHPSYKKCANQFNQSSCESHFEKWQSSTQKSREKWLGLTDRARGRTSSHRGYCPGCRG